jgi:Acetyl-CoA hydrolase/transferase C-terminal domain
VTNRRKAIDIGKSVFTFAMGNKAMYDFLDGNPAVESRPVDYLNDPRVIAQNDTKAEMGCDEHRQYLSLAARWGSPPTILDTLP